MIKCAFAILSFFTILASQASIPYLQRKIKGHEQFITKNFLKKQKKFSKALCRPGIEQKFWKLVKNYRGEGFYIPKKLDGTLDRQTIKKYLPELKSKVKWLGKEINKIKAKANFDVQLRDTGVFARDMERLLLLKERFYDTSDTQQKMFLKKESKDHYRAFRFKVRKFLETISYFHSYSFPVDHLNLRTRYDRYKGSLEEEKRLKSNGVYFYRKIVQDGSHNKDMSGPDIHLRAMIDTLYLKLGQGNDFLTEEIRYDMEAVLSRLTKQMKRGVAHQRDRLISWRDRSIAATVFYHSLYSGKVIINNEQRDSGQYVKESNLARKALQKFVLEHEAKVYRFWKREPELYRSLYVLTTILFNEVGRVDGHDALERLDVLDIVLNRFESEKYNYIGKRDQLYSYLNLTDEQMSRFPWLNVLFKEGEFSFTYFFITGSLRIFCPDMTRSGKRLRAQNISLALRQLRDSSQRFPGIRYFSRASMLGRIDMSSLWSDYVPIRERPGTRIKNPNRLTRRYKRGYYRYLYHFENDRGEFFKVVEIDKSNYALEMKTGRFYTHRNPHYFKYFKKAP